MIPTIQLLVGLLLVISVIAFIAVRLKVPASILLVLAGVALGLPSALPNVELSPEVVLLLVLSHLEMFNARRIVRARAAGDVSEIGERKKRHGLFGAVGTFLVVVLLLVVCFWRV